MAISMILWPLPWRRGLKGTANIGKDKFIKVQEQAQLSI